MMEVNLAARIALPSSVSGDASHADCSCERMAQRGSDLRRPLAIDRDQQGSKDVLKRLGASP